MLSADNKQPDTRRPESQRLAELEASRLSCVRPLQKIGRNLDFAPSEGAARRWCLCSDVRAGVAGGGGGDPAGRIQGPLPGCQRGIKLQKTDVKRCCVFSSLLSNLLFSPLSVTSEDESLTFISSICRVLPLLSCAHPAPPCEEIAALPAPAITPHPGLVPTPPAILLAAAALAVFQGGFEPAATSITSSPLGEYGEPATRLPGTHSCYFRLRRRLFEVFFVFVVVVARLLFLALLM